MASVQSAVSRAKVKWGDMGPRLWFLASSQTTVEFSDVLDPGAALCLMRPKTDIVLLPDVPESHEFAEFCRELLSLEDQQVVFTEDTNSFMLEGNQNNVAALVKSIVDRPRPGEKLMLYPRKVTGAMRRWLTPIETEGLLVYGNSTLGLRATSTGILHRAIESADVPSLLEEVAPHIRVRRGFVCSSSDELVQAFQALRDETTVAEGGEFSVRVRAMRLSTGPVIAHSEEELRLYDFPIGDVVLEVHNPRDGLVVGDNSVCTVLVLWVAETILSPVIVQRNSNGALLTVRSVELTEGIQLAVDWAKELHAKTKVSAVGAGSFEFTLDNDVPTLVSISNGFTTEHFVTLFNVKYNRKTRHFFSWQFTAPENMDVWTFWYRLYDNNLGFPPGKSRSMQGVFPLNFQRGRKSTFIAVADTAEQLSALQEQATALLREPRIEESLQRVGFDESDRRIWCGSARPEYRRQTQRYNLPNRCISLVRPEKDFIILPNHPGTREYWSLVKEVNGLSDDQVMWTCDEHLVMDDDVDDEIVARIKAILTMNPKDNFILVPYCVTANFERWSAQLADFGVKVFGESFEWVEKYGHKGILHRHVRDLETPSIMEEVAPNVRVAKGFVCDTADDLVEAYGMIGTQQVVIKPVFGAAGEGILFVSDVESLKQYDFPMGQVILEEFLDLDRCADGVVLSPAVHYLAASQFGEDLLDQIMVGTGYAGWRQSEATRMFQQICGRSVKKILKGIKPQGPGGFDFLGVEGVPYLTDVNTGRFNGAHYPKLFVQQYAPGKKFYCFKHKPPVGLTIKRFWYRLESADVAFVPGTSISGVFPLVYLRGLSGLFICVAATAQEAYELSIQAKSCLAERIAISRPEPIPTSSTQLSMTLIKNATRVYTPAESPYTALLLAGTKVVGLLSDEEAEVMEEMLTRFHGNVVDASHMLVVPGFVDPHVHITGGGGELGPASRCPELTITSLVESGITTVVGVTGTDSVSRSMENLLFKARALNEEGITAYMWMGGYQTPVPTITGSVRRDVCLIEQCIGVGEVAIADQRGSQPTVNDLEALGADCHVGGLLSGKAGVAHVHMGNNPSRLSDLRQAVKDSALPITVFYPTHMSRNKDLMQDGAEWIRDGGFVDFTARSSATVKALTNYFATGVDLGRVTVSSDAGGSSPSFDAAGRIVKYKVINGSSLLWLLRKLHLDLQWPLSRALPLFTSNAATLLKFHSKGRIALDMDADLLLLSDDSLEVKYVFAKGQMLKSPTFVKMPMVSPDED
eukprot:m.352412 g.352412  ORF g.352412 m.352412 type:complete len:1261 (-) comp16516_c0_seq1:279-4061(-)